MSYFPTTSPQAVTTLGNMAVFSGYANLSTIGTNGALTTTYTQPAVGGSVTITVPAATVTAATIGAFAVVGGAAATAQGGVYRVTAKPTGTTMTVQLLQAGAVAPGGSVVTPANVAVNVHPIGTLPTNRGRFFPTDIWMHAIDVATSAAATGTVSVGWGNAATWQEFVSAYSEPTGANLISGDFSSQLSAAVTAGGTQLTLLNGSAVSQGTIGLATGDRVRVDKGGGSYQVTSMISTQLTAAFTQPALAGSVTMSVSSSASFAATDYIFVEDVLSTDLAGVYVVTAVGAGTITATLQSSANNTYDPGITSGGTVGLGGATVYHGNKVNVSLQTDSTVGSTVGVVAANTPVTRYATLSYDARGVGASIFPAGVYPPVYRTTVTTASFVQVAPLATVTVTVTDNRVFAIGSLVYVGNKTGVQSEPGLFTVTSKTGYRQMVLTLSNQGGLGTGNTVPAGTQVVAAPLNVRQVTLRARSTARLSAPAGATIVAFPTAANTDTQYLVKIFVRGFFTG